MGRETKIPCSQQWASSRSCWVEHVGQVPSEPSTQGLSMLFKPFPSIRETAVDTSVQDEIYLLSMTVHCKG